jgi:hypothetical protein
LDEDNDPLCREVMLTFLNRKGLKGWIGNPNYKDIDLIHECKPWSMELERFKWRTGEKFPYSTIHLLERKWRYFLKEPVENEKIIFVAFNNSVTRCAWIEAPTVRKYLSDEKYLENVRCYLPYEGEESEYRDDLVCNLPEWEFTYIDLTK